MEFFRWDDDLAQPLEGSLRVTYLPVRIDDRNRATVINLGPNGDTRRRQVEVNVLLTVVSGSGELRCGPNVSEIRAGDVIFIEAGDDHAIWTSDSPMRIIVQALT